MRDALDSGRPTVAYVLKGFPRLSEIFIASEIERLERRGLSLDLIVLKPSDEEVSHPVVQRIRATPRHLPGTTPLKGASLVGWLRANLPAFAPSVRRVARRHPIRLAHAAGRALAQTMRARDGLLAPAPKVYLKEFLQAAAVADRIMTAGGARHIHAHFAHGATTVAWFASTMTGLPFSFTAHARDIYEPSLNPAGLLRRKLLAARFAVTCTGANLTHLRSVAPEARVYRVYHGLNTDFTRLLNGHRAQPPNGGPVKVLAVGRLVEKKGFDVLIDALALLVGRGVTVQARIVGEPGAHSEVVRARIRHAGLGDDVQIIGAMDQAGLYAEYTAADLFCLPCRVLDSGDRDGIPNVLMEAMACGLPVVTTDVSGIPELVTDGENGVLVPPESPAALADALQGLARDPDRYRRISDAAMATVRERFDGDRLTEDLLDLLREAS
jgi:glycosyltransferase involved in cell wall biosynthesis